MLKSPCRFSQRNKGFSLVELMVVIMVISILASVMISIFSGRVDAAKWSEANAAAGTIRTAVSTYVARCGISKAQADLVRTTLDDAALQAALGFSSEDLTGTYFVSSDYTITSINVSGHATVEVTASRSNAPQGTKTLTADGSWQ